MRVLITNNTLANRAGTEMYVRDVVKKLLKRGHLPIAYSQVLGEVAEEIKSLGVPVLSNLADLGEPPHLIHGQHHMETMQALTSFPGVPCVYFFHGWRPWEEQPPLHPRIYRYVSVDLVGIDHLRTKGIESKKIRTILNGVDLEDVPIIRKLPARVGRALIFSNHAADKEAAPKIKSILEKQGIEVVMLGGITNKQISDPFKVLGEYDLVFAKGRSAIEALACGAAVIVSGYGKLGELATLKNIDWVAKNNFGSHLVTNEITEHYLLEQVEKINSEENFKLVKQFRAQADQEKMIDRIEEVYTEAFKSHKGHPSNHALDAKALNQYLNWLGPTLRERYAFSNQLKLETQKNIWLEKEVHQLRSHLAIKDQIQENMSRSVFWKARNFFKKIF